MHNNSYGYILLIGSSSGTHMNMWCVEGTRAGEASKQPHPTTRSIITLLMNYLNLRIKLPVVLHDLLIAGTAITKPFLHFPLLCENALFKFPVFCDRRGCLAQYEQHVI